MIQIKEVYANNPVTKSQLPDADFVINPYTGCPHKCIYCYAEFMKRFTDHKEAWGDFVDVKVFKQFPDAKKLAGKSVLLSSVTDPYNMFEKKYKATQRILTWLAGTEARVEILTKSSLILRDLELLKSMKKLRVGISLNTLDDDFRKRTEPMASPVAERLKALEVLKQADIETYLFVSPIFPGITGIKQIINQINKTVKCYCFENLNLRGAFKARVLNMIAQYRPELNALYADIYSNKNNAYWENLKQEIGTELSNRKMDYKIYFYHEAIKNVFK